MAEVNGGVASVSFAGIPLNVGESVSYSQTRNMRTTQRGLTGPVGTTAEPRTPFIEVEVYDTTDDDLRAMEDLTGPAQVDFNSGRWTVVNDARLVGEPDGDGANGKITLRFEGLSQDWG